jgi:hypothetical protein
MGFVREFKGTLLVFTAVIAVLGGAGAWLFAPPKVVVVNEQSDVASTLELDKSMWDSAFPSEFSQLNANVCVISRKNSMVIQVAACHGLRTYGFYDVKNGLVDFKSGPGEAMNVQIRRDPKTGVLSTEPKIIASK